MKITAIYPLFFWIHRWTPIFVAVVATVLACIGHRPVSVIGLALVIWALKK